MQGLVHLIAVVYTCYTEQLPVCPLEKLHAVVCSRQNAFVHLVCLIK